MLRMGHHVLLAAMFSMTFAQHAWADRSEGAATARQGVVRCGGSNFLRLGGTEIHTAAYILRNFDSANPIVIDRLRFFDATGAVLFDSAVGGLPQSENGILGPGNNTLGPDQTGQFNTDGIVPFLPQANRPIQMEIEWSAARPALSLDVITVRLIRQRDPATGAVQAERSRSAIECRSIVLRK